MPLILIALLAFFSADRAAAKSLPFEVQSDINDLPRPVDVLRQDSQQSTDPNNQPRDDWFELLLRELSKRGELEPLAPPALVPSEQVAPP
jgi:hypothetical protein